jgi:hypothetical protein
MNDCTRTSISERAERSAAFLMVRILFATVAAALFLLCQSINKPDLSADLAEYVSVWQYCKALSVYQDSSDFDGRIPGDPFAFVGNRNGPAAIMATIKDTLKGGIFTRYLDSAENAALSLADPGVNGSVLTSGNSTVFFQKLTDRTACLTCTSFMGRPYEEFKLVAPQLASYQNIVVNLKNNQGGRLDFLDSILGALLPAGTPYIWERNREFDVGAGSYVTRNWRQVTTAGKPMTGFENKRYVVLTASMTASASEIMAAALYEAYKVRIIGEKSFGKGMGQNMVERRTRKPLLITSMLFKGISPRIGDYLRKGIVPDTVIASWRGQILAAVANLEPGIDTGTVARIEDLSPHSRTAKILTGAYSVVSEDSVRITLP